MPRPPAPEVEDVVADLAVLAADVRAVVGGSEAEQLGDRGGDVDEAPGPGHQPVGAHSFPGDDEGRPRLHHVERSVLAAMPALVRPVVGGRVDHAQVGRGGVVEELGDLREPERIRVLAAGRVGVGAFRFQPGELVGGLVGERVGTLACDLLVAAALGPPEADPPVVRPGLVRPVAREQDHVDDGIEGRVEQHLERPLGVVLAIGGDLVNGDRRQGESGHLPKGTGSEPIVSVAADRSNLFFPVRTFSPKPSDIERAWHVIDADGAVLGRLATEVAKLLRGKHKPTWAPHVDVGDHVIVVNAAKLDVGPRKAEGKVYWRHSGYPGGIKSESLGRLLERDPEKVVRQAVKGMVPKGRLGRQTLKKLRVYAGPTHPHTAQKPVAHPLASGARR